MASTEGAGGPSGSGHVVSTEAGRCEDGSPVRGHCRAISPNLRRMQGAFVQAATRSGRNTVDIIDAMKDENQIVAVNRDRAEVLGAKVNTGVRRSLRLRPKSSA